MNSAPRPVIGPRDGKGLVVATRQVHEMYESRAADLKKRLKALDTLIEKRQRQLSEVESRVEAAGTTVDGHVTRLDAAITSVQDEFNSQIGEWQTEYDTKLKEKQQAAEESRQMSDELAQEQRKAEESEAKATLARLDELHEEAKGVVGATAERTTATDFEDYAGTQEQAAKWWAIFAVALGAGAVVMVVFLVARSSQGSELLTALKALGSLGLLGVMTFAARQVTHHRAEAKDARQIALSLKALGPFVATLPEDQQQTIRQEIALHVFGRPFGKAGPPLSRKREPAAETAPTDAQE